MFVTGVIDHKIQNQLHASLVTCLNEILHIFHSTIGRQHLLIIGYIIAHIVHGRVIHRRQPHHIDAQRVKVGDFLNYTGDITPAITVGVIKRCWIDLTSDH
jgi:hypothetical protein